MERHRTHGCHRQGSSSHQVLQKLGKADETKDDHFDQAVQNFKRQETEGSRLQREMKAYLTAVKAMQQASINLTESLHEVYEPDWHGKDDVLSIGKNCDALWEDFHQKLVDSSLCTLDTYLQQFPDLKIRVAKRSRKLIDYDSARHHLETIQAVVNRSDRKVSKAEEELKKAQKVFDELNVGLQDELPTLWDSRVGFYINTFKNVTSLEAKFHREISVRSSVYRMIPGERSSVYRMIPGERSSVYRMIPGERSSVYRMIPGERSSVYRMISGERSSVYRMIPGERSSVYRMIPGERSSLCKQLYEVMTKLGEQHSDKMFTIQGAPSDSGPLRLSRAPSPPDSDSDDSPVTTPNHMLAPASPGPPRPKSPSGQLKKGPPVPPPPKTPTKELHQEQIIDLFGGQFLPAASLSQAEDSGFAPNWAADFSFAPENGDTVPPATEAAAAELPAAPGPEDAQSWPAAEELPAATGPEDAQRWPAADGWGGEAAEQGADPATAVDEWEATSRPSRTRCHQRQSHGDGREEREERGRGGEGEAESEVGLEPARCAGQSDAEVAEVGWRDRRKSTPGLRVTNEHGQVIEDTPEGCELNLYLAQSDGREGLGSGSEYETPEERGGAAGQNGGWANAEDDLGAVRDHGLTNDTTGGSVALGTSEAPHVQEQNTLAGNVDKAADWDQPPKQAPMPSKEIAEPVADLTSVPGPGHIGEQVIHLGADPFAEISGAGLTGFVTDPFGETPGDIAPNPFGGGGFESDPFAETQGEGGGVGFGTDPFADAMGKGAAGWAADPFANDGSAQWAGFPAPFTEKGGTADSGSWQEVSDSSGLFFSSESDASRAGSLFSFFPGLGREAVDQGGVVRRAHKEPESSDLSEDEVANRRYGKLYQEIDTEKEENESKAIEAPEADMLPAEIAGASETPGAEIQATTPPTAEAELAEIKETAPPTGEAAEIKETAPPTGEAAEIKETAPPTGEAAKIQETAPPTGEAAEIKETAPPTGEAAEIQETAPPTGEAAEIQETAPTTGEAAEIQETAPPTGEAAEIQETAPPTGEAAEIQETAPTTGEAAEIQETAPPTGEAEAAENASSPKEKPARMGQWAIHITIFIIMFTLVSSSPSSSSSVYTGVIITILLFIIISEEAVPTEESVPSLEELKESPLEETLEKMPIPSVVIEPASSNEGDDDRDIVDIISPTSISNNGVMSDSLEDKNRNASDGPPGLPTGYLYKVETLHDFEAANSDELDLKKGDMVLVIPTATAEDQDAGWLTGIKESDWLHIGASAHQGLFPENFTQRLDHGGCESAAGAGGIVGEAHYLKLNHDNVELLFLSCKGLSPEVLSVIDVKYTVSPPPKNLGVTMDHRPVILIENRKMLMKDLHPSAAQERMYPMVMHIDLSSETMFW
ncbi:hypothetical protein DPEC_G00058140 [Dallia pectoralis]|uniref:Uncharacterized protein n=1 Tax=Dallia pectoralis TaxID=75939 RepID=A0ACC2H6B1_DALPE|nr:hypothetical protein DPEC_G00058140 [Dallia pectoralis]